MARRPSFLDKEPPAGYIPGIGRGASGFTTRADVGTGRLPPQHRRRDGDDDDRFADAEERDRDDEEADEIYNAIEERLRLRHKKRIRVDGELEETGSALEERGNLGKISQQFIDLKKELSSVSDDQWANLPEVGDLTKRNKRMRQEANRDRLQFAAPDSLMGGLGEGVDIGKLTSERERLLGSKIDAHFELDDNAMDQESYMQQISSLDTSNEEEVKHIKAILNSYTKADPNKSAGWIARARLEEFNKNFEQAKKLIQQGCNNCPRDEEIWIESVRLHRVDLKYSKIIVAEGVKFNPKSIKLWLKATELEQEDFNKRRVLRKAIDAVPLCEEFWLQLVDLEESNEDRVNILTKSLEIIPLSETLWLKLIGIQEYKDARATLNKARKTLGNDNVTIWLRACRLEFEHGDVGDKVEKLIKKAFKECTLSRDDWYARAVEFEKDGMTFLATLIVCELLNSEEKDYELWCADSERYKDNVFIMKTILNQIVIHFPKKTAIWRKLVDVYKKHFELDELFKIFENVVELMPRNALFWLMYSKEVWKNGYIERAKSVLNRALEVIPSNVDIWCALMKLESLSKNFSGVDKVFTSAKTEAPSERVWYKYVHVLRERGMDTKALEILDEGLLEFTSWRMFLQKAQILRHSDLNQARQVLSSATKQVPERSELWIEMSRVDVLLGNVTRARSSLDIGLARASNDLLWLEKLKLEQQHGDQTQVVSMLARALQEFPSSSLLWDFKLMQVTKKSQRKTMYQDALQATSNHVRILLTIGSNFYREDKLDKAQRWFERAVETDTDFGDAYGWLSKTFSSLNDLEGVDMVERRCVANEPRHGDLWPLVSKALGAPTDTVTLLNSVVRQLR